MDYINFKNSTAILDQSVWQPMCHALAYSNVDVYKFLSTQNIETVATVDSACELSYQPYKLNLFGTSLTASDFNSKESYVLSSANGSLTVANLDSAGFPVDIIPDLKYEKFTTASLWDSSPYSKKLTDTDKSNIYLGRYFKKIGQKFFIFSNDKNQIRQAILEGFDYLKPGDLFLWMAEEKVFDGRKLFWIFKKMQKYNEVMLKIKKF
ncbi:MAG: hypothetical protein A2528_03325 [Candidatus Staskawiczbacteria bacterium RIFOXYD2_FULL_37_9]|uniref:Uncharacterized protein n=1 Tax=Candidatus Staskawiczbacteria bacterium RIFOXYB1_FULL_37_44 TaxID=1802223 RepID=A0A1G2IUZ2_9BACT|nr:MAG: hypothetical protein A2358_02090 [Candidatus Staskawiczbacteria bacterium RIFOXYB1_FULL_37_44]OGZ83171.1 MAG: hypothetical protein A2416_01875 [Candidatus Staskawiczbacteria bacterium RIFOXYC1_FULL_37_52]OGZ94052.1 MAG: hypothetical protein A2528_03325 [Candidatus Staskawiczbacteria bacterium RIFOXYD2_FULL_37_9]